MVDWTHRMKGLALAGGAIAILGLVVGRNPGALGVGVLGLIVGGVLAMLAGLAWLVVTGASER